MKEQRDLALAGLHEVLQRPASALVGERQHGPQRIGRRVPIPVFLVAKTVLAHTGSCIELSSAAVNNGATRWSSYSAAVLRPAFDRRARNAGAPNTASSCAAIAAASRAGTTIA